jgi:hypothetical protein
MKLGACRWGPRPRILPRARVRPSPVPFHGPWVPVWSEKCRRNRCPLPGAPAHSKPRRDPAAPVRPQGITHSGASEPSRPDSSSASACENTPRLQAHPARALQLLLDVDGRHVGVPLARRGALRERRLDTDQLILGQLDVERADVLLQVPDTLVPGMSTMSSPRDF